MSVTTQSVIILIDVVTIANMKPAVYDNEITSLIDIYFLRISFTPSEPF